MHALARLFGRSALVVKKVAINEASSDLQVEIVARKAGLISWILSLLGIDSTFTMRVYPERLESVEGSLSGHLKTIIPMTSIDTYTSGFTKPIQYLVIGVALLLFSFISLAQDDMPGGVAFIIFFVAVIFFIMYFLKKCLVLSFTTCGANGIFFLFKRSVIEGVPVDEKLAERVAQIVKRDYIEQTRK